MARQSSPDISFQSLILKLQAFWAARGCVVLQRTKGRDHVSVNVGAKSLRIDIGAECVARIDVGRHAEGSAGLSVPVRMGSCAVGSGVGRNVAMR